MRLSLVLSRYFGFLFLKWFIVFLLAILFLVFVFDITELLRRTSSQAGFDVFLIGKLSFLKLPSILEKLFPFITLFASMFVFWRLNRYHELDIAKSAGVSIWGLLAPLAVVAGLIGVLDLLIVNPLASRMMLTYEHLNNRYFKGNQGSLAVSESGLWVREQQENLHTIYHFSHLNPESDSFGAVHLFQSDSQDRFMRRIDAASGSFKGKTLFLNQAWISAPNQLPYYLETYQIASTYEFSTLRDAGADPQSLSFWDLPTYTSLLDKSGVSSLRYRLHWHVLMARAAWLVVMVLLAAACSMRSARQGGTLTWIVTGLLSAFLLYFGNDVSLSLGSSNQLPAVMAAWGPIFASGLLGLTVLFYFEDG